MTTSEAKRVRIVAEAGVNHNGNVDIACRIAEAAHLAGADAVKFQTYQTDRLVSRDAPLAAYQRHHDGGVASQEQLLRGLELSAENFRVLSRTCARIGIDFLSTPFDCGSLRFLVSDLDVRQIKIGSGDV